MPTIFSATHADRTAQYPRVARPRVRVFSNRGWPPVLAMMALGVAWLAVERGVRLPWAGDLASASAMVDPKAADASDAANRNASSSQRSKSDGPKNAVPPTDGEWTFGAYAGVSSTHNSDITITRQNGDVRTISDVVWDGQPFRNPIYYGFRVSGWAKGLPVGGMIDFTHAKALGRLDDVREITDTVAATGETKSVERALRVFYDKLEFSHGHNMLTANGLFRLPLGTSDLSPYVGAGAGISLPHVEVRELNAEQDRTYGYQNTGLTLQALFGMEVRLVKTSVFVEYKLSFSPYRVALRDTGGGLLATDLLTHHVIGGFTVRQPR